MVVENKITPIYLESLSNFAPLIESETRGLQPNSVLIASTPYDLTWDEQAGDSVVSVPAAGTARRNMSNDKAGAIDLRRLKGIATSQDYTLFIFDNEYQRYMSNRPIHSRLIVGNGQRPFELPIPMLLHETQSLVVDLADLSGAPNDVRLAFEGQRYYFDARSLIDELSPASRMARPFFYTTDSGITIGAGVGTEVVAYITFISDADFYLRRMLTYSTGAYKVRVSNVGTGFELMNGWIHSGMIGGNAEYYRDFEPQIFQRKTQFKLRFQNLTGSSNTVYFALAGFNIYYRRT